MPHYSSGSEVTSKDFTDNIENQVEAKINEEPEPDPIPEEQNEEFRLEIELLTKELEEIKQEPSVGIDHFMHDSPPKKHNLTPIDDDIASLS